MFCCVNFCAKFQVNSALRGSMRYSAQWKMHNKWKTVPLFNTSLIENNWRFIRSYIKQIKLIIRQPSIHAEVFCNVRSSDWRLSSYTFIVWYNSNNCIIMVITASLVIFILGLFISWLSIYCYHHVIAPSVDSG